MEMDTVEMFGCYCNGRFSLRWRKRLTSSRLSGVKPLKKELLGNLSHIVFSDFR